MSPNAVNYSGNLNVAMLAVGGLLWIPPIYFWGRAPVILWSTVLGTIFTLVCVVTPSFQVFYGFRALMGITLTAGQTVGLAYIKDIFYFHEHARKIGLWASLFLCSPFLAPCLGNIMVGKLGAWRPVFWLVFALCCFDLLLILAFLDETLYRRDITTSEQPPRGTRLTRVTGIWQVRHRGYLMPIKLAIFRLFVVFSKPIIIPCMLYYASTFMWAVGINITGSILLQEPVALGGYGFGAVTIGFVYFTPVVSVGLGELFGHYFNDWNAARYIARHGGVFRPEARLWVNYVGGFLMAPGLVLLGQALQHRLTVGAVVMGKQPLFQWYKCNRRLSLLALTLGWGMYMVGIMIASVGITAYVLDAYPTSAGEVSALLNFARAFSGFTVGYFQVAWGERTGFGVSFGIQGMIVGVATILLALIHIFGERLRKQGGALPF